MSGNVHAIKSLLPEFYFDMISRLPVGIFFVVTLMWRLGLWETYRFGSLSDTTGAPFLIFFVVVLSTAGYVAGVLLSALGSRLASIAFIFNMKQLSNFFEGNAEDNIKDSFENSIKVARIKTANTGGGLWGLIGKIEIIKKMRCVKGLIRIMKNLKSAASIDRYVQDYLQRKDEHCQTILPKMNAEMSLCFNFAAAIGVLGLIHGVLGLIHGVLGLSSFVGDVPAVHFVENWPISGDVGVLLLAFALAILCGVQRRDRLIARQISVLAYILKSNGSETPKGETTANSEQSDDPTSPTPAPDDSLQNLLSFCCCQRRLQAGTPSQLHSR